VQTWYKTGHSKYCRP